MNLKNQPEKLSRGCQLCQQGKWLCIFLTYRCNAGCHFCPAPFRDDQIHSAFGNKKEEVLSYLVKTDFEGISFSGGDPFLVFDRLMEWFLFFKNSLPDYYYWVYTNGLDADRRKLELLSSAGMDEIRFNIAASGYTSEKVLQYINLARDLFPYVSVEIPSIKNDYRLLDASLKSLEKTRIDYLNLNDYILSESDTEYHTEQSGSIILNKNIHLKYALSSIENTQDVIKNSYANGYHFHINHCSLQQKELQMTWRRKKMGQIFIDPEYDIMLDDGVVCNYYCIPDNFYTDDLKKRMLNPEFRNLLRPYLIKVNDPERLKSCRKKMLEVSYIPQMEINQKKNFLDIKVINEG